MKQKISALAFTFSIALLVAVAATPKPAYTLGLSPCGNPFSAFCYEQRTRGPLEDHAWEVFYDERRGIAPQVAGRLATEFTGYRQWLVNTLWEDNLLPALMLMSDQLSATAMYQTQIIGTFFDAKHQLETQRTLQKLRAQSHKDYHPSAGMCTFGSSAKSLASSERRSELAMHVMSQRFQDRMLGNANTSGALGPVSDIRSRLKQYREKFCDPMDNDGGLFLLCDNGNSSGAQNTERMNKDIDFLRTVDFPMTLNLDFTNTDLTDHEEEVIALGDNLYGHDVFPRISGALFLETDDETFPAAREAISDARAMLAKLSVAYNSYSAITANKAAGTAGSREFMESVLQELGISGAAGPGGVDDITRLLGYDPATGDEIGPSYNAQMEVLTKKIYQNPDFYTNLYDKPANVERKKVAMQAIGLMQKFDLFKSYLRNEMNTSVLLELAIEDLQAQIENDVRDQSDQTLR